MMMLVRIELELNGDNEDALYDRLADMTYEMRTARDVGQYVEEIVDLD